MRIQMERKAFDSLPINTIGHVCFEPMVPLYQEGISQRNSREAHEYRAEFYKSLTPGQRALFGFFSYYDHAIRSNEEFQRISNLYVSQHIFGIVIKGAEYFNDDDMCQLLLRIEQNISEKEKNETANVNLDTLYARLNEITPYTLTRIGACIKENPTEFICLA